ncbi:MAG: esterase-like activity of phytase family protein [Sedimenticola sp.]|nr:esterase-like activity of phytase family protein [Sedimenticola sp.]
MLPSPALLLLVAGLFAGSPHLVAGPVGQPIRIADHVNSGDRFMGIQLLDSVALRGDPALAELSGLAWDQDEQRLLAVSDRGLLLHLQPHFEAGRLVGVDLLQTYPLLNRRGLPLEGSWRDAEGLTLERAENGIRGDTHLLISFERQHRIERYRDNGRWLQTLPLPKPLRNIRLRSNRGLESLTRHPQLGVVTAPELPPAGESHFLASSQGRSWNFVPQEENGSVVGMETLPNGDLLLLERAYTSIFSPWIISLGRIPLPALLSDQRSIEIEPVARMDSSEGWLTQNMEGLARHGEQGFFMVSDDGNRPWAQTQLLYFRLLP